MQFDNMDDFELEAVAVFGAAKTRVAVRLAVSVYFLRCVPRTVYIQHARRSEQFDGLRMFLT